MSARDAIGWGALGAGLCAALVLAVQGLPRAGAGGGDGDDAAPETTRPADKEAVAADPALQARLELKLAPLRAAAVGKVTHGLVRGIDAGPLAAIESEIAVARSAAQASAAEARRLAALAAADQSASRQSVEAARAQAAADAARLRLAGQRVALEYGPGLGAMDDGARRALLARIAAGQAALVRVDVPGGGTAGVHLGDGGTIRLLGPAAQADPRLQTAGQIGIAHGAAARQLNSGRVLDILADSGGSANGVLVPADAVVRWRGGQWVYRRAPGAGFARVELVGARPVEGGWLVASGLSAGDEVVIHGAGALLALDRAADLAQESD